jgi:stage II sporulation protein D
MRRLLTGTMGLLVCVLLVVPAALGRGCSRLARVDEQTDGTYHLPVHVYFPATGRIEKVPLGEYLIGVVAAEMPADFEMEALKAQMVVARTYTFRRMQKFGFPGGCSLHHRADVCASPETGQAYIDAASMREKYGILTAIRFHERLREAEEATRGLILTYMGAPIEALYHATSGRMTEDVADYFGRPLPYLKPVPDDWGRLAPRWEAVVTFPAQIFAERLGADFTAPVARAVNAGRAPVEITERTASGRAKSVRIGNETLSGRLFRERLGLRSTDFSVALRDGQIVITTRGHGHGVGMSQYGANAMAKAGSSWREIVAHYYPGTGVEPMLQE